MSVERREIICPWHRFRYSLIDGKCVASNNRPPVETFAVAIEGDAVFLELPERNAAVGAATPSDRPEAQAVIRSE